MRFLFTCFLIMACGNFLVAQENIALGKRVGASGTTAGRPAAYLSDGNYSTVSYPSSSSTNFHYIMDLDKSYNLDKIVFVNTSSPERLSNYRVEVFSDNFGIIGDLTWSANIREDNSNSGSGGKDVITGGLDPDGVFNGRYIKITSYSSNSTSPAIAEIEVYEAPLPIINYFESDAGNISITAQQDLPTSANLSWLAEGYTSLSIDQSIGNLSTAVGTTNVAPTSTTEYVLTATNEYGSATRSLTIGVDESILLPEITEFMASNEGTLVDEEDEKEDWIELYNPNDFSINVGGYYLTDDNASLSKWQIPSRNISPKGYLVIFASKKDLKAPETPLHTNFSLDADGEYLALVDMDGSTVLQQFPTNFPATEKYPNQKSDVSYGIDAEGNVGYFLLPTPNALNSTTDSDYVKEVKFTPNRGVYTTSVTLAIDCDTPDAIVRYTTDGSEPTNTTGTVLSGPLTISETQIIRATAFKDGYIASKLKTHTYVIVSDVINSNVMNTSITGNSTYKAQIEKGLVELPSISLVTSESINNTIEIQTSLEWMDPIKNENLQSNAGIKNFGGGFTVFDKKNFRIYFRGVYGDKKLEHPLFEGFEHTVPTVQKFDQIELRAGGHDMSSRGFYMSNRFADDIMLEAGTLNPHGRFVNVYLNGVYWGQYHLRERWNDAMFAEYFDANKEDFEAINGNNNLGGWASALEIPYAGDGSAWENVKSLREDYEAVKEYVDVPNLISFMLSYMYGSCENEFKAVGSIYPGQNGFKFYLNDGDGYTRSGGNRTGMDQPGNDEADGPGSIFSMLIKEGHPDYMTLLGDQIQKMFYNNGILTPDRITALLNERCTEVENSIVAESARWGYLSPSEWTNKKNDYINGVLPGRTATVISQFKNAGFYPSIDAPAFSQNGGDVDSVYYLTLSTNTNIVYYTDDGSDPRLAGGAISDHAIAFQSGDTEYIELVGASTDVSATVPTDGTLGTDWTQNDFVEPASWLKNTGGAGVGYDNATTYVPHIDLSVKDEMANKNTSLYVRYLFDLEDLTDIESLILRMKCDDGYVAYLNGEMIATLNAPATLSWNSAATTGNDDGVAVILTEASITHGNVTSLLKTGSNLLAIHGLNLSAASTDFLIEPQLLITKKDADEEPDQIVINDFVTIKARAYDGGQWSAINEATFSLLDGGFTDADIVINELMASNEATIADQDNEFDDWIELYNIGDSNIDLEGYFLSDDSLNLTKWKFPASAIINTESYMTVWADEDDGQDGLHADFKLSASGETIYFVSPSGSVLDEVSYSNQTTDLSYGRMPNGTGDFEIMSPTFGLANGGLLDEDQDGVTVDLDCDDKDETVGAAQASGTACDDGDSTTESDVIQPDGCTCAGVNSGEDNLAINELLASNEATIADQDSEFDDWIELYNNGISSVDLGGYFLSDDMENLSKWPFPTGTSIGSEDYLVVWADEDADQEGFHANFKLSSSGESIYLVNPLGVVIDEVSYTDQITDISYGRAPNGTGDFEIMSPTFGAVNGGLIDEDQDGVTIDLDCDDKDETIGAAQAAGTACDDGDSATENDVIQLDGCTCAGTNTNDDNLVLNELMASNGATIADQDDEFDDWIELYNNGTTSIDLGGYFLSDNIEDLSKWSFPAGVSIDANSYLVVWADENDDQEGLHASFKLSAASESVYLVSAAGVLIDEVSYVDQTTDISYGRIPNGTGDFQIMNPTYNAENTDDEVIVLSNKLNRITLEVYPNPSSSYFHLTVNSANSEERDIVIYDLLGNIMFHKKVFESSVIDTSDWSSGMYIIQTGNTFVKISVQ